ncbi:MAG: hypothetical protein HC927_02660, partial [Deltaproteobacteria bacterium]|nr:hypothetical protein [Deltaproteobacteria bacterium]
MEVQKIDALPDGKFASVTFDTEFPVNGDAQSILVPRFAVGINRIALSPVLWNSEGGGAIKLDGIYTQITKGDLLVLIFEGTKLVRRVASVVTTLDKDGDKVENAYSNVSLTDTLPQGWNGTRDVQVLFSFLPAATLYPLPLPAVPTSTLTTTGILATRTNTVPFTTTAPFVLVDADGQSLEATAEPIENDPNKVRLKADPTKLGSITELRFPITAYTNLSRATRGESIRNEILGNGNSAIPFQTFTLAKKPLTYLSDASGRRNTLEVFVNGRKWRQAPSFYGALPTDQIYVVSHTEEHDTIITFGDGELGMRVPTGVSNVVANYRFGVGGNVPANSITVLKRPIKGVRRIFNPLPATGGKAPRHPRSSAARPAGH